MNKSFFDRRQAIKIHEVALDSHVTDHHARYHPFNELCKLRSTPPSATTATLQTRARLQHGDRYTAIIGCALFFLRWRKLERLLFRCVSATEPRDVSNRLAYTLMNSAGSPKLHVVQVVLTSRSEQRRDSPALSVLHFPRFSFTSYCTKHAHRHPRQLIQTLQTLQIVCTLHERPRTAPLFSVFFRSKACKFAEDPTRQKMGEFRSCQLYRTAP